MCKAARSAPTRVDAVGEPADTDMSLYTHISKQFTLHIFIEADSGEDATGIGLELRGDLWIRFNCLLKLCNNRLDIVVTSEKYAFDYGCLFSGLRHMRFLSGFRVFPWEGGREAFVTRLRAGKGS